MICQSEENGDCGVPIPKWDGHLKPGRNPKLREHFREKGRNIVNPRGPGKLVLNSTV